jgi:hypothetical protein
MSVGDANDFKNPGNLRSAFLIAKAGAVIICLILPFSQIGISPTERVSNETAGIEASDHPGVGPMDPNAVHQFQEG